MKKLPFKLLSLVLLSLLFCSGCGDVEPEIEPLETDPAKIIIGKWELWKILTGYETINGISTPIYSIAENPDWYIFDSDSIIIRELYIENELLTFSGKYWIDSLLHYDRELGINPWYFEFFDDNNSFKITNAFPEITGIENIYKRIK